MTIEDPIKFVHSHRSCGNAARGRRGYRKEVALKDTLRQART
jgi:Tfp pilus assembly ATPase PilU